MLEDILTDLASLGYVVSNVFQIGPGANAPSPFGTPGWQVYLRNLRNTRAGQGRGDTLGEALAAALANCEAQPTYERKSVNEWGNRAASPALPLPPRRPMFVTVSDDDTAQQEDLF